MKQTSYIKIPIIIITEKDHVSIMTPKSSKLEFLLYGQGKNLKEAKESFWQNYKAYLEYFNYSDNYANKWILFKKGNWKHIGGKWFQILGFHIYFRYGKNMKRGLYIPFTKLNISFTNFWKIKYKNDER